MTDRRGECRFVCGMDDTLGDQRQPAGRMADGKSSLKSLQDDSPLFDDKKFPQDVVHGGEY